MKRQAHNIKELGTYAKEFIEWAAATHGKDNAPYIVGLYGELGAGKTAFVKQVASVCGITETVISPTFIIMRRYRRAGGRFRNIFHIDCYRLSTSRDLEALKFKEMLEDRQNIIFIEWAERVKKILPRTTTWISFQHGNNLNERIIKVKSQL